MDLEALEIPLKWLKLYGIWITSKSSKFYIVYAAILQLLFVYIYTFLSGMYLKTVTNLIDFADSSCYFVTYFVCCFKCINIIIYSDELEVLFEDLKESLKVHGWNETYIKPINRAYFFVKVYWYAAWSNVIPGGFTSFLSNRLAYRMWFPYSLDVPIFYYISAVYQWIGPIGYSACNVFMDMLPVLLIGYYISMLQHLSDKLETVKSQEQLENCIKYQKKIIELVRKTEKIFSVVIFIQGLFSSIVLCTTTIALTLVDFSTQPYVFIKFITFMVTMISQIFIPCFYGTELRLAYAKISNSLFYTDWMDGSKVFRKNVLYFVQYAMVPMKIVAFGNINIDLQNFGTICNSAYSLFSVFKRTR